MKRFSIWVASLLMLCGTMYCSDAHFISNAQERAAIEQDFASKKARFLRGNLFDIFNENLSIEQREALTFLYAYMPLADIVDHEKDFFLRQVNSSFKAREEMPWGETIPEREFRHFVLPVRVNNEDLDNSREVFYEELKDRVKGLSLKDAVLEINHWCHEKVVYTPSDGRTSSPLATIKTAHGRCGEESTFTVAALRAMCIPARQVYTPRWAHTDDNHAWVEAWVDGKWYFLGACEPEPVLNLAWFNAPVSRGMLMHTKVFGHYHSDEEVVRQNSVHTEINVTANYAPTGKAELTVVDTQGQPVKDAVVDFKVYNYGEFFTVSRKLTDEKGHTFLSAGKGDMLCWVSKDGKYGFEKITFGKDVKTTITLDKTPGDIYSLEMDIIPPVERSNMPLVTDEQREENTRRMMEEDSIRNAYIGTFPTEEACRRFAQKEGFSEKDILPLIKASRGNHQTIQEFLAQLDSEPQKRAGIDLLTRIAEKDLRDITLEVLNDHLETQVLGKEDETFREYVRNPRVWLEMLTPYKSFFKEVISDKEAEKFRKAPLSLVKWVKENIEIDSECNLGSAPISPRGVWTTRKADVRSRNIFFVSMARALGIPARIDEVTGKVQLMGEKHPIDVNFEQEKKVIAPTGTLILNYPHPLKGLDDPKYYTHFTISKITPECRLQLLTYEEGELDMGGGTTWAHRFKRGTAMDEGDYVLITGIRLANGGVLSTIRSFSIKEGKTTVVDLHLRESKDEIRVIGSFNSESLFQPQGSMEQKSILSATGRGYFVIGILGVGEEPTNHTLRDIAAKAKDFEEWGAKLVLLFTDETQAKMFKKEEFPNLPATIVWGIDVEGKIQAQIQNEMKLGTQTSLPIFIIADTFNRVVYLNQGYTIGLGEQMMSVIHKL